jgi:hypothetical protein
MFMILNAIVLSVTMLIVIVLNVVMLIVIVLNVVMLNVTKLRRLKSGQCYKTFVA